MWSPATLVPRPNPLQGQLTSHFCENRRERAFQTQSMLNQTSISPLYFAHCGKRGQKACSGQEQAVNRCPLDMAMALRNSPQLMLPVLNWASSIDAWTWEKFMALPQLRSYWKLTADEEGEPFLLGVTADWVTDIPVSPNPWSLLQLELNSVCRLKKGMKVRGRLIEKEEGLRRRRGGKEGGKGIKIYYVYVWNC